MDDAKVPRLLAARFAFTQDRLLTPAEFAHEARDRGRTAATPAALRRWHETGWLVPLLHIAVDADPVLAVDVPAGRLIGLNAAGDAAAAARDGRLRDGADVPPSLASHDQPPNRRVQARWLYSEWQLLDVRRAPANPSAPPDAAAAARLALDRDRILVLCVAAEWALPGIVESLRLPEGAGTAAEWTTAAGDADPADALAVAGWNARRAREEAEALLLQARRDDPNREWLPLVRHMTPLWWRRLHGLARDAVERRIAAEVLLAVHARLAARGEAAPLPDVAATRGWHPLHDRLHGPELDQTPLDAALADAGLSPHPRVVLLVEGQSEAVAARALLNEVASETADWVRVHTLGGATTDPKMLARFAAAPAVSGGPEADGARPLTRPPTALVVHADAEGRWDTPAKAARERQRIVDALNDEVRAQGATANRAELGNLVHVDIAPRGGFELANFSLGEVAVAIGRLAGHDAAGVEAQLACAVASGRGVDSVLGPLHVSKTRLATALIPLLVDRLPDEVAGGATTPIIRAVLTAVGVASSIPRGRVVLSPADPG